MKAEVHRLVVVDDENKVFFTTKALFTKKYFSQQSIFKTKYFHNKNHNFSQLSLFHNKVVLTTKYFQQKSTFLLADQPPLIVISYFGGWHCIDLLFKKCCTAPSKVTGVISLSDILNFLVLRPGGDDPSQPGCTDMFSKVKKALSASRLRMLRIFKMVVSLALTIVSRFLLSMTLLGKMTE